MRALYNRRNTLLLFEEEEMLGNASLPSFHPIFYPSFPLYIKGTNIVGDHSVDLSLIGHASNTGSLNFYIGGQSPFGYLDMYTWGHKVAPNHFLEFHAKFDDYNDTFSLTKEEVTNISGSCMSSNITENRTSYFVPGLKGSAWMNSGSGEIFRFVRPPTNLFEDEGFTVAYWNLQPSGTETFSNGDFLLLDNTPKYLFSVGHLNNGTVHWRVGDLTYGINYGFASGYAYGAWNHYAFVLDKTAQNCKVYVNGILQSTTTFTYPLNSYLLSTTYLGRDLYRPSSVQQKFEDFRIYSKPLNSQQIGNLIAFDDPYSLTMFEWGHTDATGSIPVFMHGYQSTSQSLDLSIFGHSPVNGSLEAYIRGMDSYIEDITLFLKTIDFDTEAMDMFINGDSNTTNNLNLFIKSLESLSGGLTLFLSSYQAELLELIRHIKRKENQELFIKRKENKSGLIRRIRTFGAKR